MQQKLLCPQGGLNKTLQISLKVKKITASSIREHVQVYVFAVAAAHCRDCKMRWLMLAKLRQGLIM